MTHKLFVYGTLKSKIRGPFFFSGKPKTAITHDHFLVMGGGFPRAVAAERYPFLSNFASHLYGEVYEITDDELASCDRYEGAPSFYERKTITVETWSEAFEPSKTEEVYFYEATGAADCFDIFSGERKKDELNELGYELLTQPKAHSEKYPTVIDWN